MDKPKVRWLENQMNKSKALTNNETKPCLFCDVKISAEIQNKIDYHYKVGILNYLCKEGIIDHIQLQALIKKQSNKLQKLNKYEEKEVA